jgi:hypothetical protein
MGTGGGQEGEGSGTGGGQEVDVRGMGMGWGLEGTGGGYFTWGKLALHVSNKN